MNVFDSNCLKGNIKAMNVLSDLKKGEVGSIKELDVDGDIRRRLQDMGFVNGSRIKCVGKSPLGDPKAYLIKGSVIAMRRECAAHIFLERITDKI